MPISLIPVEVVKQCRKIYLLDPHQLATPCWQYKPFLPEAADVQITLGENNMPIKVVLLKDVPERRITRTGKPIPEVVDLYEAVSKAKDNQAICLTLSAETLDRFSFNRKKERVDGVKAFIRMLNSKINKDALPLFAYSNDGETIYVVKEKN
jgi:hypothetical protein